MMLRYLICAMLFFAICPSLFAQNEIRNWTSNTGKFQVDARFVSLVDGKLKLIKENGEELTVDLSRLSDVDIRYATNAAKTGTPSEGEPSSRKKITRTRAITNGASQVKYPDADSWEFKPDVYSGAIAPTESIETKIALRERATFLLSRDRQMLISAIETNARGKSRFDPNTCGLQVFNLKDNKPIGPPFILPSCRPIDISPDNTQLLVTDQPRHRLNPSTYINVFDTSDKKISSRATWMPYGKHGVINGAWFVDDDHVLTIDNTGALGLWNLSKLKLVWQTQIWPNSRPAVSANRKHVYVHNRNKLVVIEALTGMVVGQTPSVGKGISVLSVNDTATRLVGVGRGITKIWDLSSGKLVANFAISAIIQTPTRIIWVDADQILVDTPGGVLELVDLEREVSVCCYFTGALLSASTNIHARFLGSPEHVSQPYRILVPDLPQPEVRSQLQSFVSQSMLTLEPGSKISVSLELEDFQGKYDADSELKKLKKLFRDSGYIPVDEGTDVVCRATLRSGANVVNSTTTVPNNKKTMIELVLINKDYQVVWRANRDKILAEPQNLWSCFVIPRRFRIIKVDLDVYRMVSSGAFKPAILERSYDRGWSYKTSFNHNSSGNRSRPGN